MFSFLAACRTYLREQWHGPDEAGRTWARTQARRFSNFMESALE